eukprot:6307093-Prymnesium_polylepis.1
MQGAVDESVLGVVVRRALVAHDVDPECQVHPDLQRKLRVGPDDRKGDPHGVDNARVQDEQQQEEVPPPARRAIRGQDPVVLPQVAHDIDGS